MMNIAIQTNDELICLFTSSIERAESVLKKAQVKYINKIPLTHKTVKV